MKKLYSYRMKTHTGARPTRTMMRLNLEHICIERSKSQRELILGNIEMELVLDKKREEEKEQNEFRERLDEISRIEDLINNGTDPYLKVGFHNLTYELKNKPFGRGKETLRKYQELIDKHSKMTLREKMIMKQTYNIYDILTA